MFNPEIGTQVPDVILPVRVAGEFQNLSTGAQFAGKRVLLFGLPGAFTPTCSNNQVPTFDQLADQFKEKGIEEIYCVSVNDSFVMNKWFEDLNVQNIYPLPDGNGEFTELFGASVQKANLGFGIRSWRYAVVLNDGKVEKVFSEEGFGDNIDTDPYEVSTPENVLASI